MSTFINTNTTASMAALNLNNNNNALSNDIEQLSTGLRINSASDDAAGYVVSENMSAQLSGLNQATMNTNDAVNMTKTAEGALTQVQNLLISMRQLAVQASNLGVNDSTDVQADQTQIASAIQSINEISTNTQFGTKFLLNGSSTAATTTLPGSAVASGTGLNFAVSSNGTWTSANAGSYNSAQLSASTAATDSFTIPGIGSGPTAITASNVDYSGSISINGTSYTVGSNTAAVGLASLNTAIANSGYVASVSNGKLVFTAATAGPTTQPTIDVSSLNIQGATASTGAASGGNAGVETIATAAGSGGALASGTSSVFQGTLDFTDSTAGLTINKTYAPGTTLAQIQTDLTSVFGSGANAVTAAIDGSGNVTFTSATNTDVIADNGSTLAGYNSTAGTDGSDSFVNGTAAQLTLTDSSNSTTYTSFSSNASNGTNYYTFANGLVLSTAVNAVTTGTTDLVGSLAATAGTSSTGQNLEFQIGANEGQTVELAIGSTAAAQLGTGTPSYTDANGNSQTVDTGSVADINVTTFKGAQDAIAVLDQAISQISTDEANLGAFQSNVLQSNVQSLGTATTNLQAAQATIMDTDMASTIVDYTKNQILVQSATSALAYANQMPQSILKLLQ